MGYSSSVGSARQICWSKPAVRQATRFSLPSGPAIGGAAIARSVEVMSLTGQWNNARFIASGQAAAWADITFELYGIVGNYEVLLHAQTPRQAQNRTAGPNIISDTLLAQGFLCDSFLVKAVVTPGQAAILATVKSLFTLYAWGQELEARPEQLLNFSNAGVAITGSALYVGRPNHLKKVSAHNISNQVRFLMFFDRVAAPVLGLVPAFTPIRLRRDQQFIDSWPERGHWFTAAQTVGISTTDRTFTASVAGDALVTTWFRTP